MTVEFLLDVVAASDEGVSKANPAAFFFAEFERLAARFGLIGGFNLRVGDRIEGKHPDRKRRLLLPPKRDISRYIEKEIGPFFNRVAENPQCVHRADLSADGSNVAVHYNPAAKPFNSGGYGLCESPFSLKGNTLFRKLDTNARQLRQSGYTGPKGIVVADGDCRALQNGGRTCGSPWSRDEIVEHFLGSHSYIDFVTTTHCNTSSIGGIHQELSNKVYWQRPFDDSKISRVLPILNAALRRLPLPEKSPGNAWRELRAGHDISNGCRFGVCTWTPNRRLEYSSRTFLEIVAGTMSWDEFSLLLHERMPNRGPLFQFFRSMHRLNQKLGSVSVELTPAEDDDTIVFDLQAKTLPQRSHAPLCGSISLEIPTAVLISFFARLAHEVLLEERPLASLGDLPMELRASVRKNLYEGRTIVAAELRRAGESIRLTFGSPDPALSPYT